jgi:broad specificity phosphatase PhoE
MQEGIQKSLNHIAQYDMVIGFMRHAAREPIPLGEIGNEIPLTKEGISKVIELKQLLATRVSIAKVYSSPVLRCMETANLLASMASDKVVTPCNKLGAPGIFVENPELATPFFLKYQNDPVALALALLDGIPFPGFSESVSKGVQELIRYFSTTIVQQGSSLCITHDSILGLLIGYFFPGQSLHELWPDYLETLFVQLQGDRLSVIYRGLKQIVHSGANLPITRFICETDDVKL